MKQFEIAAIPGDGVGKKLWRLLRKCFTQRLRCTEVCHSHLRLFHGVVIITWNTVK